MKKPRIGFDIIMKDYSKRIKIDWDKLYIDYKKWFNWRACLLMFICLMIGCFLF